MAKRIYKYMIPAPQNGQPYSTVTMPAGAVIRKIGQQEGRIFIWAEVDDGRVPEVRWFLIHPTGAQLPEDKPLVFLETVFIEEYVFHIYEQAPLVPRP